MSKKCPNCNSAKYKEVRVGKAKKTTDKGIKEFFLYKRQCKNCNYHNDETAKPAFTEYL